MAVAIITVITVVITIKIYIQSSNIFRNLGRS